MTFRVEYGNRYFRGFTLVEVVVAFTILALLLAVLFQIFARGQRALSVADDHAQASMIAESLLAEAGVDGRLRVGERRGAEPGGFQWVIRVGEPQHTIKDIAPSHIEGIL